METNKCYLDIDKSQLFSIQYNDRVDFLVIHQPNSAHLHCHFYEYRIIKNITFLIAGLYQHIFSQLNGASL